MVADISAILHEVTGQSSAGGVGSCPITTIPTAHEWDPGNHGIRNIIPTTSKHNSNGSESSNDVESSKPDSLCEHALYYANNIVTGWRVRLHVSSTPPSPRGLPSLSRPGGEICMHLGVAHRGLLPGPGAFGSRWSRSQGWSQAASGCMCWTGDRSVHQCVENSRYHDHDYGFEPIKGSAQLSGRALRARDLQEIRGSWLATAEFTGILPLAVPNVERYHRVRSEESVDHYS
ncbi:hypothetical protein GGX14DRAFT_399515 [Mycena pura]|uniref:Uncharacterized protein n=1 Tax=Mycena pura TaxID=153505 RepID=A0AAD6V8C0_9AGAR|nr:hypothetical protein GGX14DRAFT_399515 [Mycena pura]